MNSKTILIVDDSPTNIKILDELLSDFRKKVATNGEKAIEIASSDDPPDLILLDIEMPKMDGFEACSRLKADPKTQRIPVIFLTSMTDKDMTIKGFKLGACDFMTKPFNHEELMVRVNTQLDLAQARQELETTIHQMEVSSSLLKQSGEELARQNLVADNLLLNILPDYVARELKERGRVAPRHYPIATVLFADLVGFSRISKGLSPQQMVDELNDLFVGFDLILERNRLEKIKTIGDGYMAAAGIPVPNSTNPVDAVKAGLEMVKFVNDRKSTNAGENKPQWEVRVGIHTGELIAGVIGKNKFAYDIWGDTVNVASRMESGGEKGMVNISGITYQLVKDQFNCVHRGKIDAKNMGKMDMYSCI
jgi:adenylate cyclase